MPGLTQSNGHYYSSGFWSKDVDGVSYNQLHKFWSELSPEARQELLRIDKQALLEQARKNMCCSRCHGLLLEGFLQIVSYGRSSQQKGLGAAKGNKVVSKCCAGKLQDPSVHQWGGLTTTRDGLLTLLDCYLNAKSFKALQIVFESGRARERERELLCLDACGGGGRAWTSQGLISYSRSYGTRETCALHTTRLSCDTLVDFCSALEEESQRSLLRMKEDDFVERLTYRFDCKKFCRGCRRNVIREFKELKDPKRMHREPRCTEWFCVPDTTFHYEVGIDSVRADWSQSFTENAEYHHFEWAIGTEEGESDILEFSRVGKNKSAKVNGLDLRGLHECYITVRAFKKSGVSSEKSVKAHALRGRECIHSWLVVGDGFVSIRKGGCIRMFFEHAEEAEEEEDEVMVDKDGNEIDSECLRPQKHAKNPELAREFLLDATTVIFKEQVEKAFREGTARQNAHSVFISLSTELLEQRVHIACKEIVTLEKQNKLLEEEEREKREEEERKERKRTKEREKKLRRKERMKEKEREKEQKNPKTMMLPKLSREEEEEDSLNLYEKRNVTISCVESENETVDVVSSPSGSPDDEDAECLDGSTSRIAETNNFDCTDNEVIDHEDENGCLTHDNPRPVRQTERVGSELRPDHALKCSDKRNVERYDYNACSCKPVNGYRVKKRSDIPVHRGDGYTQSDYRPRGKVTVTQNPLRIDPINAKKLDSMELKDTRNSSNSDVSSVKCSTAKAEEVEDDSSAVNSTDTLPQCKVTEQLDDANRSGDSKNYNDLAEEDKKTEVNITPKKDPMMSRTSSSDNCSSCLSEGDSNTASSNNGNTDSSSISDSEIFGQQSERRGNLVCHEKITEKGTNERDVLRTENIFNLPADNGQSKLSVPSQNMENMLPGVNTGPYLSQPLGMMFPQIPMSVFQAHPTMGYYHQPPVSWSAANGFTTFPHPNDYVYTGPLGYSLNGDSQLGMQYGTPFFNPGPVPVFHPFAETNAVDQPLEQSSLKEANRASASDENFSLFHFGGPDALSTGTKSKPEMRQFSGGHVFRDPTENTKKEKEGEEYNLFATSNSYNFSIF